MTFNFFSVLRELAPHSVVALEWALKITVLFLLAKGVAMLLRHRSARARCWAWRGMFSIIALLGVVEFAPVAVKQARPPVPLNLPKAAQKAMWNGAQGLGVIRTMKERILER